MWLLLDIANLSIELVLAPSHPMRVQCLFLHILANKVLSSNFLCFNVIDQKKKQKGSESETQIPLMRFLILWMHLTTLFLLMRLFSGPLLFPPLTLKRPCDEIEHPNSKVNNSVFLSHSCTLPLPPSPPLHQTREPVVEISLQWICCGFQISKNNIGLLCIGTCRGVLVCDVKSYFYAYLEKPSVSISGNMHAVTLATLS